MGQSKGFDYDKNHLFWIDGLPPHFKELVRTDDGRYPGHVPPDMLGFNALPVDTYPSGAPI